MADTGFSTKRKWILVPVTLVLMVSAWFWAAGLGDSPADELPGFLKLLAKHTFMAPMVTLGVVSIIELLVCKVIGKGLEPVIGHTIFGWVIKALMTAVYCTVFALTAIFAKASGQTPGMRVRRESESFWSPRQGQPVTLEAMKKQ